MDKIDGHGHSQFSDGSYTLNELSETIFNTKNSMIILTDHNTLQHFYNIPEIIFSDRYLEDPPIIIPGIEITCQFGGQRCHTIWIGGRMDQEFIDFIDKQRLLYIDRETTRLKIICNSAELLYDEPKYLLFCGLKTPNWTITFNYLIEMGLSEHDARDLMRSTKKNVERSGWWQKIPSLSYLYDLAQNQKAILFLCHLGDIVSHNNPVLVNDQLKAFPDLYIDMSESENHLPITPALFKVPEAFNRIQSKPYLVGTDYHTIKPKPININSKLRSTFIKALQNSGHFNFTISSASFIYPGLYAGLFGGDILIKYQDLFHRMTTDSIENWIDIHLNSEIPTKSNIVETIISLAVLKNIQADILLNSIADCKEKEEVDFSIINNMIDAFRKFEPNNPLCKSDIVSILSLGDIYLRVGQYALHSNLLNNFTKSYPQNFIHGYSDSINRYEVQELMEKLWSFCSRNFNINDTKLIWRLKSPCSALSTVTRNLIEGGNSRHGIASDKCIESAALLLRESAASEKDCKESYNNLIYDHLAATIIIKDSNIEYKEILNNIFLPFGWEIVASEHLPRRSYHHRLWLLIKCPVSSGGSFIFELMVKKEIDFHIGRAYQWYEKNCMLALSHSPWKQDGTFDRNLALNKWKEKKSIVNLLSSEIKDWYNYGKEKNIR